MWRPDFFIPLGSTSRSCTVQCLQLWDMKDDLQNDNLGSGKAGSIGNGSATPVLDKYSRDLTELAAAGRLDPVIGRDKEIGRLIQILSRRTKNNPCLVGEPGR